MAYEFRLPDIGEGVAEGEVVRWFVVEGEAVKEDAPLVAILTDKANVEIPSPKSGKVVKLHAAVGEKVKVGGLLVTIETAGGAPAAAPAPPASAPKAGPAPAATFPDAPPHTALPSDRSTSSASATAPASPSAPSPTATSPTGARVLATPAVRRMAAEKGVDLASIRGTGPNGRVTEADLAAPSPAPAASTTAAEAPTAPASKGSSAAAAGVAEAGTERVPIRGLRRVISEHMAHSVHTAAHFTYVEEIDASELVRLRDRMAKHVEKQGAKLSYLPFIVKAVVAGLRVHPWMNARMDDERQELVVHKEYNIGIATAAPDGLLVPVVHHADHKSVTTLAKEIAELAEKGRAGKLTRAELSGGTFTITSLGALGGVLATPILNYPEVAILGVHRIVRRPVYLPDGSVGPADLLNLSVSLDHRVLDGIVGAQFLAVVKANLEDPHLLFSELA